MRQFRDFPELTLDKLGLSDFDIVERKFFVNFRRHSVTVPAVFILPTKDQKKLQKFLKEKHTTSKKVLLPEEELVLA